MTSAVLLGFGCLVSYFAIKNRELVIGILASAIWLAAIAYTRINPIGSMVTGDTADSAILLALIGLMAVVPIMSWKLKKSEQLKEDKEDNFKKATLPKNRPSMRSVSSTRTQGETADEYYDRLHGLTHPNR